MNDTTKTTFSGLPAEEPEDSPTPRSAKLPDGQHVDHWILSAEERAKGFVRPVRYSYVHVGLPDIKNTLRDLTDEEKERHKEYNYVKFEVYPENYRTGILGKYWTKAELDKVSNGCGAETKMPQAIAETYARKPDFYGTTFCVGCCKYLPVGEHGEFVWAGTDERVGT